MNIREYLQTLTAAQLIDKLCELDATFEVILTAGWTQERLLAFIKEARKWNLTDQNQKNTD